MTVECPVCKKKLKGDLKRHMLIHSSDYPFECSVCQYRCKRKQSLKTHMLLHSNEKPFKCSVCQFRCKRSDHLTHHMQSHTKTRYNCECGKSFNTKQGRIKHGYHCKNARNYRCELCDSAFNIKEHLKRHQERKHDIGAHKCDYCLGFKNSRNEYADPVVGTVQICRACFKKTTGAGSRVELEWRKYVDDQLGTDGLIGSDQAMRTLGGCSLKRPDRLYADPWLVEVDECDEHQHANYTCEQARIMDLYHEHSFIGKPMVVIRWNPDRTKTIKTPLKDRMALFVSLKRAIRAHRRAMANPGAAPRVVVFYMFFERTCPAIVRDIMHFHVDSASDLAAVLDKD